MNLKKLYKTILKENDFSIGADQLKSMTGQQAASLSKQPSQQQMIAIDSLEEMSEKDYRSMMSVVDRMRVLTKGFGNKYKIIATYMASLPDQTFNKFKTEIEAERKRNPPQEPATDPRDDIPTKV